MITKILSLLILVAMAFIFGYAQGLSVGSRMEREGKFGQEEC